MKIALFGTSEFAVPTLEMLVDSDHELMLVVTAPDRPKGRGRKVFPSPVAVRARELGLAMYRPTRINAPESIDYLRLMAPELVVVVAYGQILGRTVLTTATRGFVNLHGSLLPAWRGAAPIARSIQAGEKRTGVTLQHVVLEVDAGDVIDAVEMEIEPHESAGVLSDRMAFRAAELMQRNLEPLDAGTAPRTAQDSSLATYAAQLEKKEGRIPWEKPARQVHDHIRAMTPWPSAYTHLPVSDGSPERIIVRKAQVVDTGVPTVMPGTVTSTDGAIEVGTGYNTLRLLRLLRSGRKETDAESLLRGFPIEAGARFQ